MIVRCTKKLRTELRLNDADLLGADHAPARLDEWFCDLLRIDRQKYVLCTHARTLFSTVVPRVRRADLVEFHVLLRGSIAGAFEAEGLPVDSIESVASLRDTHYGRTNSRSVLGSMNDLAYQYRMGLYDCAKRVTLGVLTGAHLNRTPMSAIGMRYAIDAMRSELSLDLN